MIGSWKTRSINYEGPLEKIEKYMFVQVQAQMYCTGRKFCLLMSYHPETDQAHYFVIKYENDVLSVILTCLQAIITQSPPAESKKWETPSGQYVELWRDNSSQIPSFGSLSELRRLLTEIVKDIKLVKDVNNIVFD